MLSSVRFSYIELVSHFKEVSTLTQGNLRYHRHIVIFCISPDFFFKTVCYYCYEHLGALVKDIMFDNFVLFSFDQL